MREKLTRIVLTAAGVAALTGGTIAVTDTAAAKTKHKHASKHAKKRQTNSASQPAALTGDTKTQAEAAALNAVPGGTVEKSFAAKAATLTTRPTSCASRSPTAATSTCSRTRASTSSRSSTRPRTTAVAPAAATVRRT